MITVLLLGALAHGDSLEALGPEGSVELRPLPWLDGACRDARFPRLAGAWAMGCEDKQGVSRAWNLDTGERIELSDAPVSPGLADGVVFSVGEVEGLWRLPAVESVTDLPRIPVRTIAPPATDGTQAVVVTPENLQLFVLGEPLRKHVEAVPAPWYPPAISGNWLAWVDLSRLEETGEDILLHHADTGRVETLAGGPGNERHVVASGDWLAWLDDDGVVILHLETREMVRIETDAHTTTGLGLWGSVACWEEWSEGDVDLRCSDGLRVRGSGHQRRPSRWGRYLLFESEGRTWVAVLDEA